MCAYGGEERKALAYEFAVSFNFAFMIAWAFCMNFIAWITEQN
jgi:hypothetical protein